MSSSKGEKKGFSRREFIQRLLEKTGYVAPVIASYAVADLAEGGSSMGMGISRRTMKGSGTGSGKAQGFPAQ